MAEAHGGLGNVLKDLGEFSFESVACYRRAVELKPDFVDAHVNLGLLLANQGQLDAAAACYQRGCSSAPTWLSGSY